MKIISRQAIVVGLERIDFIEFPNLVVVGCNATSTEHIDKECAKRGIKVISLKDYPNFLKDITSTAEHTIGLIIALLRNYKTALNVPYKDRNVYMGHKLKDKILGLIGGGGRVGTQVANIARALGMRVLIFEKHEHKDILHDLLKVSDIVSVHIPLLENEGFFTKEMFEMMKPTSYFVNTSRLGVVENGALLFALESSIIKGAAIDFIEDDELLEYSEHHHNLVLTNHLGGCTFEDMSRTEDFIINKVKNFLNETKFETNL